MPIFELRKNILLSICSLMLINGVGCHSGDEAQVLNQEIIEDNLGIGEILSLSALSSHGNEVVCILYPYQQSISDILPQSNEINSYLRSSGYVADESRWALVMASKNSIELLFFNRTRRADILAGHQIQADARSKLPANFRASDCARPERAALLKVEQGDRFFVIFGEIK